MYDDAVYSQPATGLKAGLSIIENCFTKLKCLRRIHKDSFFISKRMDFVICSRSFSSSIKTEQIQRQNLLVYIGTATGED